MLSRWNSALNLLIEGTFVFSHISVSLCELFYQVVCYGVRREDPPCPDWWLVEHADLRPSLLHLVVLEGWVYHESVVLLPLQKRLLSPGLVVVKSNFHVVPVLINDVLVELLVLFAFLYLLVEREDNDIVRVKLLSCMFVVEGNILGHDRPWIVETDEDGIPQIVEKAVVNLLELIVGLEA